MVQVVGFLPPTWETYMELLAPGFCPAHPWLLQAFEGVNQWVGVLSVSLPLKYRNTIFKDHRKMLLKDTFNFGAKKWKCMQGFSQHTFCINFAKPSLCISDCSRRAEPSSRAENSKLCVWGQGPQAITLAWQAIGLCCKYPIIPL